MHEIFRSQFRLPGELADKIRESADASGRSMNAEVVARLERSFQESSIATAWPELEALTQRIRENTEAVLQTTRETQDLARKIEAAKVKKQ